MDRISFDPGNGNGTYTTLVACQTNCITPTWDCDGQGNCFDPGNGNGTYTTLVACQANCIGTFIISEKISHIKIYPNPSKDIFNIELNSLIHQDINIKIFNIIGKEIIKEELQQFEGKYVKTINQHTIKVYFS